MCVCRFLPIRLTVSWRLLEILQQTKEEHKEDEEEANAEFH